MTEAQMKKKSIEIHKQTVGTFTAPMGEKWLDRAKETFMDRPIYKDGLTFEQVAFRQGQADVIRQILIEIDRSK